jgi:beta-glucosidase
VSGTGSGYVTPAYVVAAEEGVRAALAAAGRGDVEVVYSDGSDISAAVALAEGAAVVVVVPAVTSGEGSDRETLSMGEHQNALVTAIAQAPAVAARGSLVVAAVAPGAVLMPWAGDVRGAILMSWLPGQEAGSGLADVLFGAVNLDSDHKCINAT